MKLLVLSDFCVFVARNARKTHTYNLDYALSKCNENVIISTRDASLQLHAGMRCTNLVELPYEVGNWMTYPLLEADTQSLRYKFSYLCAKSGRFVDAIGVHGKAILAYTLHGNDVERKSTYGSFEYLTLR